MESDTKKAFDSAQKNGSSPVNMQIDQFVCDAGLTKREYFAAMALQGILANKGRISEEGTEAIKAVGLADDLLYALER